jgi:hypothetical protein
MPKVRLDSWKSIADYLERSPRTVQRWHACHALAGASFWRLQRVGLCLR